MAYELNENKLMKVVKCYQEKIQLSKNINSINGRIRKWKTIFTGRGNAPGGKGDKQDIEMDAVRQVSEIENR